MEISRKVDWKAPGAAAAAEASLKQALVDAVEAHRTRGTMAVYLDNEKPERVAEELDRVLEDSPHPAPDSALLHYLVEYPRASLPDAQDLFYWSRTKFLKSVVSLHHLVIQEDGEGPGARYHVADEHILDSHYFLGYLDVLTITDRGGGAKGCYVTRLNRTRIDPPRFLRGTLLRKIKRRMKELMEEDLRAMKARLDAEP